MAQKRMFDKTITNSDKFLEMPDSCQNLYFHLSMNADDDGFIDNWKSIMRMTGHKNDDLKLLIEKSYIIPFDSGIIVIKHWRINNYLRSDRYKETNYKEELRQLVTKENGEYSLLKSDGIPLVYTDKNRIEENSIDKNSIEYSSTKKTFSKPTLEEVEEYCKERNNDVDAQMFIDFYESKGWYVGKNKMKDWKACVRTWEKSKDKQPKKKSIHEQVEEAYQEAMRIKAQRESEESYE